MDLQGIGALAAAAVAAVGIPAALLVGRWQMRAALRTAEETGRAGTAQAEATYHAALDAVRAEAGNAHAQWRRGLQREAYFTAVLAANKVFEAAYDLAGYRPDGSADDDAQLRERRSTLKAARVALGEGLVVVSLEGPTEVVEKLTALVLASESLASTAVDHSRRKEARRGVDQMCSALAADDPLRVFRDAALNWEAERTDDNEQRLQAARAALDESVADLARDYVESLDTHRRDRWDHDYYEALGARDNFLATAREVLDTPAP